MGNLAEAIWDNIAKEHHEYYYEITTQYIICENSVVKVYGINVYNRLPYKAFLDGEQCVINDISDNIEDVKKLRDLLEEMDVSPVHLRDIVEDYLIGTIYVG